MDAMPLAEKEMRQEFIQTVIDLAGKDERIVFLDSDLASSSGSAAFKKAYPDRFFNCGIQEANLVGVAAGMSAAGYIPFVHSFAAFISRRAADQVFVSCAYARQNVRLIGSDPGVSSCANGGTHMALEDIALMRAIPGVIVIDASDPEMLKQTVRQSMERPGVYYFRLFRKTRKRLYPAGAVYRIGKAHVAWDKGSDAVIISAGFVGMTETLAAAELLEQAGIHVKVIDMFTINPLDEDAVRLAAKNAGALVTVDNHNINGGLGSAVGEVVAGEFRIPFQRIGVRSFGEVGTLDYIVKKLGLDAENIVHTVKNLLDK